MLQGSILLANFGQYLFGTLLFLTSLFLILLVLVQRGRGGGLAGAFGGMGGQSAFGTKAGDVFTKITMVTAAAWILLSVASLKFLGPVQNRTGNLNSATTMSAQPDPSNKEGESDGDGGSTPDSSTPDSSAPDSSTPGEDK